MTELSDPILRAAARWLRHLPQSGLPRLRTLFVTDRAYSDLSPSHYFAALSWLIGVGIADSSGRLIRDCSNPRAVLFDAAVANSGFLWLPDAEDLILSPDDLPQDIADIAAALDLALPEAFARARHVWGKVNTEERARIGAAGEQAVVELLRRHTSATIEHVSLQSDGHGYDISLLEAALVVHLEVKATVRRAQLAVFLSRNEFETMRVDPAWVLIAVRLDRALSVRRIATVNRAWIEAAVPQDRDGGRWASVQLRVPAAALTPGIPPISPMLHTPSPILTGAPDALGSSLEG